MFKNKNAFLLICVSIITFYFLVIGVVESKGFLAPLVTGIVLALLMLPVNQWMEKRIKRVWASLFSSIILFLVSIGLLVLISFQIQTFVEKWPEIQEKMEPKIEQLESLALKHTPLEREDIKEQKQSFENDSGSTANSEKIQKYLSNTMSFMANYLLVFIYVFFLLNYRRIFKNFILNVTSSSKKERVQKMISDSIEVVPEYLMGKLILMGLLAVLYSIGLGLSGVSNFILVSILAALLTLIPYVGNMIGFAMALVFGYFTSPQIGTLIGILATFSIAQFVESYILQPYVVGDRVDVHPFFVILIVILGNMVWGIIGMILAIPVLGIITVICLHSESLKPAGLLLSKKKADEMDDR